MTRHDAFLLRPIGQVESPLETAREAPHQDREGGPPAWLIIDQEYSEGLKNMQVGQDIYLITWFHLAERNVLEVHPRNDLTNPTAGVFSTRSPARPNPLGLHQVKVIEIAESRKLKVDHLDALNGTPIVDIKPVLMKGAGWLQLDDPPG